MRFRLSMISTVAKYFAASWGNARIVAGRSGKSRLGSFVSLLYWFYFFGNDFNDYCTFRFWEKTYKEKESYISLKRNDILRFKLSTPGVYSLFLDKSAFNERFKKYIHRGWMLTEGKSPHEIQRFIMSYESVIAKPLNSFGGKGIMKFRSDETPDEDTIERLASEDFIIEECIANVDSIKRIAPSSLNTVRIVTLIDREGILHILAALLRMGNGRAVTDNYHDGGMACPIDVVTGRMRGKAYGMDCIEHEIHPYSGIRFDGYKVDHFEDCLNAVRELAFLEPEARYVGWDFAITPDGIDLLEGNIPPGEDITQIAAGRGLWHEVCRMI